MSHPVQVQIQVVHSKSHPYSLHNLPQLLAGEGEDSGVLRKIRYNHLQEVVEKLQFGRI